MASGLRLSLPPSGLLAAVLFLIQALSIFCWIPRLTSHGSHISGRRAERQKVLLAVSNVDEDGELLDEGAEPPVDHGPLLPKGDQLEEYISRLEFIMESDVSLDLGDTSVNSQHLSGEEERIVLGDWMEWDENTCFGDSCWDEEYDQCDIPEEYKVAGPKVDVMAFLGIRRAEPLQIKYTRDWE